MAQTDLVKILNEKGEQIGTKERLDVDKRNDILHSLYIFVFDVNGLMLLSAIPRNDEKPNIFTNRLGTTIATLVRDKESNEEAAIRALKKDLRIKGEPTFLGESYEEMPAGIKRLCSVYYLKLKDNKFFPHPDAASEIQLSNRTEVEHMVNTRPEKFADTFVRLWEKYNPMLPF